MRREDPPLLLGTARFTDDLAAPGALHAAFVRSPHAHANVAGVDLAAARAAPGVAAALTAGDLGAGPLPAGAAPADLAQPLLAADRVRFAGEAVAVVLADSLARAVDAAERVVVAYDPLEPVIDAEASTQVVAEERLGTGGDDVLDEAEVVVRMRYVNQRLAPTPLEPSAALAVPDKDTGGVTVWTQTQAPFKLRDAVAASLGIEPAVVRVIAPAVGGSFGVRIRAAAEQVAVAALAVRLGRPVRHVETRSADLTATHHGRAQVQHVELGATRGGVITGLRVRVVADCGAYPARGLPLPRLTGLMACGPYRVPRVDFGHRCVLTNTTPVGAYRGAGRPEATALLERTMDLLAARLGLDPAEARRRNLVPRSALPYRTPTGATYDSGDYAAALGRVLDRAGYEGLRAEQASRRRGRAPVQLGIGLAVYVHLAGGGREEARCVLTTDGSATLASGAVAQGQGHETVLAGVVARTLGVPAGRVRVVQADTAAVAPGPGTSASRSLQLAGSAAAAAAADLLDRAREVAAPILGAAPAELDLVPGTGLGSCRRNGGDPGAGTVAWERIAAAAGGHLTGTGRADSRDRTHPSGAHLAVVEVDVETGRARLARHVAVDDGGRIEHAAIAEGQIHGGIAQGAGQALLEGVSYDDAGRCATPSLREYAIPRAAELPAFETEWLECPTPRNALGVKGVGESGAVGATAAVWNAVVDAVAHLGVDNVEMPATPERIWTAIRDAAG